MAPKKPSATAASKPKANTKAKVTKPAATKKSTTPATTKKVAAPKKAPVKKTVPVEKKSAPSTTKKPVAKTKTGAAIKKDSGTNPTTKKAEPKKSAAAKASSKAASDAPVKAANTNKRKRVSDGEAQPAPAKKIKVATKGPVINQAPTERLRIFVFGEGTAGELALGTAKNAIDVKRPRLNPNLDVDKVGVVQIAAGGMHAIALTHDNKILSWGVNDVGSLGRDTTWEGGLKDIDDVKNEEDGSDSDDDEDDNGLNPHESTPGQVDFSASNLPEGTRFTQIAAGDSISLALTDDGNVYGWGTFRGNEGAFGFDSNTENQFSPKLISGLKKITQIKAGANHALALDDKGSVFAWGSGQQNQLGRRICERTKFEGLTPREFGLPKGPKKGIVSIESGGYHSFAISKTGDVYSWGLNNFGETGIPDNAGEDDAVIKTPTIVKSLKGKNVIHIQGGGHHSIAATEDGDCLVWGRIDGNQIGIPKTELNEMPEDAVIKDATGAPRVLAVPTKVEVIKGKVTRVATNSDHNIVVTAEGKAWSWGFSANYQTGQGQDSDVLVPTMIDNTAVREQKLNGATTGGQFSVLTASTAV